ncbi:conserved hypothetical protein [Mesorhizobium sp. SOD10]|nr:conserved hypothetical protein [Mesorhizobium sp. SOD10]
MLDPGELGSFSEPAQQPAKQNCQKLLVVVALFRRHQTFDAREQVFLAHAIESDVFLGVVGVGRDSGRAGLVGDRLALGLRLVDLDMLLQRVDQVFLEVVGRQRLFGDLAQRDDRVLVIVARNGDLRALADLAGAMAGEQHEFKTVVDLVDAIFNGYAGHGLPLSCDGFDGKLTRSITRARAKYKLYGAGAGFAACCPAHHRSAR